MKKISLENKILQRLKEIGIWCHKGQIENRVKLWGYLGETGGRKLRLLESKGLIESREVHGSNEYRYLPQTRTKLIPSYHSDNTVRLIETTIIQ